MTPSATAIHLNELITEERVVFLDETTQIPAIRQLVRHACRLVPGMKKNILEAAVMERERIVTTGIGLGVAIPHARLAGIPDFFIVLGIAASPIAWHAADGRPVTIVFLVCGPEPGAGDPREKNRLAEVYLRIIARLMLLIKDEKYRTALVRAKRATEVVDLIRRFERTGQDKAKP
ncbi:MAG: PTS sugar transporter subunit IIA [Thermodesulfobacteriota bacterium]|nr:PTS sugar transporter subunit IIA [Thermodesulfobacteriota bacterium]